MYMIYWKAPESNSWTRFLHSGVSLVKSDSLLVAEALKKIFPDREWAISGPQFTDNFEVI